MLDSVQKPLPEFQSPQRPRRSFPVKSTIIILVLLSLGIFLGSKIAIFAQRIFDSKGGAFSLLQKAGQLFISGDKLLRGEKEGEIRVLLLGIGGENHEGGTLTDTMILATIKLDKSNGDKTRVSLVSIPRDLVVNIPGYDYRKINSAYAFGEQGERRAGPSLTIKTTENFLDLNIPYYIVADFRGFQKIIDDVGGVEINVERDFTDAFYPNEKDGYLPPLTFEKGLQKMDGARALQYVRSRHGNNNEGTDFARSRRQEQVLKALRDKVTGLNFVTNLSTINRVLEDLSSHIRTNLEPYELKKLYNLTKNIGQENIITSSIDVDSGLVCNQIEENTGAYILVPCPGLTNYTAIREFIKNQFLTGALQKNSATVEIQNASQVTQLGAKTQSYLAIPGLVITTGNFKGETVYEETVIYDNVQGKKNATLDYLQNKLGARVARSPFPFPTSTVNPDFVIVVTPDIYTKLP